MAQHVLQPYWQPAPPAEVLGRHSKFTLMVMSYEARLQTLKHYVEHYSQCPSVGENIEGWSGLCGILMWVGLAPGGWLWQGPLQQAYVWCGMEGWHVGWVGGTEDSDAWIE